MGLSYKKRISLEGVVCGMNRLAALAFDFLPIGSNRTSKKPSDLPTLLSGCTVYE